MVDVLKNELAVIFEPNVDKNNNLVYNPIDVVCGYYDEFNNRFIDENLNSYGHLIDCEKSKCYAYRQNIDLLISEEPNKSLNEIKEDIFDEYSQYNYALAHYEGEVLAIRYVEEVESCQFVKDRDTIEMLALLCEDETDRENILNELGNSKSEEKLVNEERENVKKQNTINPHKLYKEIKKSVKGQDDAIKQIVTTIWKNHSGEHNSNIIVLGPSGCGKTEILRQTAKLLDIPILMMSVSGMSQAGYKGTGTDEILCSLLTLT